MKKIIMGFIFVNSLGFSEVLYVNEYADKDRKNPKDATRSGVNGNIDIGYTSYVIDVSSSELNRAIDYNVVELRLGGSYSYGDWIWGVNGKILLDEQKSNLNSEDTTYHLNDSATIDRNEFSIFANYKLTEEFRGNFVYRYAKLQSNNSYLDILEYDTKFNYKTEGLALSLVYVPSFLKKEKHLLWLSSGAVYSQATVEVYEEIEAIMDDVSIDDKQKAFGFQLGMGYNYSFTDNLTFKISGDWYRFDFGKLNVDSQKLNRVLEQASLNEETYSVRFGVAYRFN
jgi:opacity protein-like surface antigen